jgi:hypothetical protein
MKSNTLRRDEGNNISHFKTENAWKIILQIMHNT